MVQYDPKLRQSQRKYNKTRSNVILVGFVAKTGARCYMKPRKYQKKQKKLKKLAKKLLKKGPSVFS